jgi:hypothetical protein
MKNIIKIISVVIIIISEASAQKSYREIDIALKKVDPIEITFIKCPAVFDLKLRIINNSLDSIYASDSLDISIYLPVSQRIQLPVTRIVKPKDSFDFVLKVMLEDYAYDRNDFNFGLFVGLRNRNYFIKYEDQTTWADNQVYYNNIVIRTKTSSIGPILSNEVHCFPNPFNNRIYYNQIGMAQHGAGAITIFDINGKELCKNTVIKEEGINTEDWQSGLYFYKIITENGTSKQGKLIKQ